jgi:hypothetical protein
MAPDDGRPDGLSDPPEEGRPDGRIAPPERAVEPEPRPWIVAF